MLFDRVLHELPQPIGLDRMKLTLMLPKFFERVSEALVGRVGRFQRVICRGVTAMRSK